MKDWQKEYQEKLVTVEEAVRKIPDGARVFLGHAAGEPAALVEAMVANYEQYTDVEITHWVTLGEGGYCDPSMAGHLHHNALFGAGPTRKAIHEGRAGFTPIGLFQGTRSFKDGTFPIDVALVTVTPPDEAGYVSFGVSICSTSTAARSAKLVIAQVNDRMPRTFGESTMHVSEIDWFAECNRPIYELPSGVPTREEEAIGRHIASLVEDGSTLQLGIGSMPDAVLAQLGDKKDLGIHSEMFSDGVVDLVEKGVITGNAKTLDKGKLVAGFVMGSQRLYDFVNENPDVIMMPSDYVNNPAVICQNPKVVSINACLEVDLTGQVNAEAIGRRQFSGVGGQMDFVRGASMCPDGKAILAMPSTAKGGTISRIVPELTQGTPVTTPRTEVQYIATEYGIVNLRGRTLDERAELLISIAHPDFREQLREARQRCRFE